MPSAFDNETATELLDRIDQLRPDSPSAWGTMSAPQMVCHLTDAMKVTLGEIPAEFRPGPLASRFVRWLIVSVLPIPPGRAKTLPAFITSRPDDWAQDVTMLKDKFGEVVARGRSANPSWAIHPAFGAMSTKQWGLLTAKHMDHHLRQFGV